LDEKKLVYKRKPELWLFVDSTGPIPTGKQDFIVTNNGNWSNYRFHPSTAPAPLETASPLVEAIEVVATETASSALLSSNLPPPVDSASLETASPLVEVTSIEPASSKLASPKGVVVSDDIGALSKLIQKLALQSSDCPPHRYIYITERQLLFCEKCGKVKPI